MLLPLSVLAACAPEQGGGASGGGRDSGAAAPTDGALSAAELAATPAVGGSPAWLEGVQARIAADARAITPEGAGFVSAIPGHAAVARFTDQGLILGEADAEAPMMLRFASWGAAGAERPVQPVAPMLGDCLSDALPEGDCARQLEYAHEGVTAWWIGLDWGVEFGWTVAAPPAGGDGGLTFTVKVDSADWIEAVDAGAELVDAAGETWTVSDALAWGADGAPLPAWIEVEGDALVVVVDAAGAVYPVTVDPVVSTASRTLPGAVATWYAVSVSGAGDVNGDGYDDVVLGAPDTPNGSIPYAGAAFIHHGSASGVSATANLTLRGRHSSEFLGWSVSAAGNVNGDSYDDVVIAGKATHNSTILRTGGVYVHHGSATGLSASPSAWLRGDNTDDHFGYSVSGAGDVNNDGFDDIVVGVPYFSSSDAGITHIYHGSASGVEPIAARTLFGGASGDNFGISVSGAGDVNNDGFDDVIVGAYWVDSPQQDVGAAYVFHGGSTGVASTASRTIRGSALYENLGVSVSNAGDVNGDGYGDVIIGAQLAGTGWGGAAYIHHGSSTGVAASPNRTILGASMGIRRFGSSVSTAGDLNGDGYDDIIVGAVESGMVHTFDGSASGVSLTYSTRLTGAANSYGQSVSGAGDVNGDLYDDVIIGSPFSGAPAATVHQGYCVGICPTDADGDGVQIGGTGPTDCDDTNASVGAASARYVDADQDGVGTGTVVVACPGVGYATVVGDCDDTAASVGAASGRYVDADGDGLGSLTLVSACPGAGYAAAAGDCDDANASVGGASARYIDADGDGIGSSTSVLACPGAGYATTTGDCDDSSAAIGDDRVVLHIDNDNDGFGSTDTASVCPGTSGMAANDDDCDDADELTFAPTTWYLDGDLDGHGDPDWSITTCFDLGATGRFFALGDDCDDDNDVVGGPTTYYADADADGFGDPAAPSASCSGAPAGTVEDDTDCDDDDAGVGASLTWFTDADGDGYGDPAAPVGACDQPSGAVARDGDCDDNAAAINPGATETCGDLIDSDCNGVGDQLTDDQDGDGVGGDLEATDGANDCVADDDSDGVVVEGRGDADYDGVRDYLDATANHFAVVNNNAEWANNRAVTVRYGAPAGTDQMCLSSTAAPTCTFTTISGTTRAFSLPTTNLAHTVFAHFRASASPSAVTTVSDSIQLDTVKPTNTAATATGAAGAIDLSWTAGVDPVTSSTIASEVAGYKVVYARATTAPSTCATGTVAATLHTGTTLQVAGLVDGAQYSFRICAVDNAGNVSTGAVATETPGADQTAPTGTVVIASGATHSGATSVSLGLSATDDVGTVAQMCVSNTTLCTSFVTYAATRAHSLTSGSGTKTVNVWFKDNNNNVSGPFSDTIVLDTTAPTDGASSTLTGTASASSIALSWTAATDNSGGAGVASYTVAYRASTSAPSSCAVATGVTRITGVTDLSRELTGLTAGTSYGVRVCSVDAVGNTATGRTLVRSTAVAFAATEAEAAGSAAEGSAAEAEGGPAADASADSASVSAAGAGCSTSGAAGGAGLLPLLLGALGLRRRRSA